MIPTCFRTNIQSRAKCFNSPTSSYVSGLWFRSLRLAIKWIKDKKSRRNLSVVYTTYVFSSFCSFFFSTRDNRKVLSGLFFLVVIRSRDLHIRLCNTVCHVVIVVGLIEKYEKINKSFLLSPYRYCRDQRVRLVATSQPNNAHARPTSPSHDTRVFYETISGPSVIDDTARRGQQ